MAFAIHHSPFTAIHTYIIILFLFSSSLFLGLLCWCWVIFKTSTLLNCLAVDVPILAFSVAFIPVFIRLPLFLCFCLWLCFALNTPNDAFACCVRFASRWVSLDVEWIWFLLLHEQRTTNNENVKQNREQKVRKKKTFLFDKRNIVTFEV